MRVRMMSDRMPRFENVEHNIEVLKTSILEMVENMRQIHIMMTRIVMTIVQLQHKSGLITKAGYEDVFNQLYKEIRRLGELKED